MLEKKKILSIVLISSLIFLIVSIYVYYDSYPNNFQIDGKFSVRGIDIAEYFENSRITATQYLFREFDESDNFNLTIGATRGWAVKNLTIYAASSYQDPLIYDMILFQTTKPVSLKIIEPNFLFMNPRNINSTVYTGNAESAFFICDLGKSLLINSVTSASSSFPSGDLDIMFDVIYGNISVSNSEVLYNLDNSENRILIHLQAQIIANLDIQITGKFAVESNTYSALTIDCWSSPLTAYFGFPKGFLSYGNSINEISGSQNLNFTNFRGEIVLLSSQQSEEVSIQGYAERIDLGTTELTAPDLLRDVGNIFNPVSALIVAIVSIILTTLIAIYRDREKRKKPHLNEFKDKLFPQLLRNLEDYFEPQIRLRNTGNWVFLGGLVAHHDYPIDLQELETDTNLRLLQDIENHFPELESKITTFTRLVENYNQSYLHLAIMLSQLIEDIELETALGQLGIRLGRIISQQHDCGGATEWAFRLILGANERELEGTLDNNEKDRGLEILEELQQNEDVVTQVATFNDLCSELESSLDSLIEELRKLMKTEKINGKCSIM